MPVWARRGWSWQGKAGVARRGEAWKGIAGLSKAGSAWLVPSRLVVARLVKARGMGPLQGGPIPFRAPHAPS